MVKRKIKVGSVAQSDWLALARAVREECDPVPDGWQTVRAIAATTGKSGSQTGHIVSELVSLRLAEMRMFRVTIGQVTRPVPHYKIK